MYNAEHEVTLTSLQCGGPLLYGKADHFSPVHASLDNNGSANPLSEQARTGCKPYKHKVKTKIGIRTMTSVKTSGPDGNTWLASPGTPSPGPDILDYEVDKNNDCERTIMADNKKRGRKRKDSRIDQVLITFKLFSLYFFDSFSQAKLPCATCLLFLSLDS